MLAGLLGEGESIFGVHAMVVRHVRSLMSTRALLDRPDAVRNPQAIAKEVGAAPWLGRALVRQAGRFTAQELVDALRSAARTEQEMKTSRDARLAFERWIVSVCRPVEERRR